MQSAKITSKWGIAGESLPEYYSITSNNVGLWFRIELSDQYYVCPVYYVWDTQANENILEIETKFVHNLV